MPTEPLTDLEIQFPDPKERARHQKLAHVADAMGISVNMLTGSLAAPADIGAFAQLQRWQDQKRMFMHQLYSRTFRA